jgi:hypothetical protein
MRADKGATKLPETGDSHQLKSVMATDLPGLTGLAIPLN